MDSAGLVDDSRSIISKRSSGRLGSVATSLCSQEIIQVLHPETGTSRIILGICRGEPLTDKGKRLQLLKILSLTLLPILGLWAFTVYSLSDSIEGKSDIEQTQYAVQFSVEVGKFLDRIQRERDMSVLYLSILGPETKTFLMNEYLLTDQAVDRLSDWPENNEFSGIFRSKSTFKKFLNDHRRQLDPSNYDIYVEMDFYNFLIGRFVEWMYGAIKESNQASIWKILVAYQKIVTGMEHVGIERSLGTVFYVEGGFPNQRISERYNNRVNNFKANYRSAVLYSHIVDPIFQEGVTATGTNLTAVIEKFRYQMQSSMHTNASIEHGQWWFDNMTLYLDTLLIIQQDLASLINGELQNIIDAEEKNLTISACFLVVVFLMCPLVIYTVEALTSDIQKYALAMVHKTKELSKEKKKTDSLLYQMVPRPVAKALKERKDVDAEYFKSVTVLFSEIQDFMRMSTQLSPMNIVALLNELHTAIDTQLDNHDVYKVETINDCYMVASGLPMRIGNRHSAEVANLALDLIHMIKQNEKSFDCIEGRSLRLRIGISTGACMAGIVGIIMPRYCLFGDTINTASRMKTYSLGNRVHISVSTYQSLQKHAIYIMQERGIISVKGKGEMTTYWLIGRADLENFTPGAFDPNEADHFVDSKGMPGEVRPYKYRLCIKDNLSRWMSAESKKDDPEKKMTLAGSGEHDLVKKINNVTLTGKADVLGMEKGMSDAKRAEIKNKDIVNLEDFKDSRNITQTVSIEIQDENADHDQNPQGQTDSGPDKGPNQDPGQGQGQGQQGPVSADCCLEMDEDGGAGTNVPQSPPKAALKVSGSKSESSLGRDPAPGVQVKVDASPGRDPAPGVQVKVDASPGRDPAPGVQVKVDTEGAKAQMREEGHWEAPATVFLG